MRRVTCREEKTFHERGFISRMQVNVVQLNPAIVGDPESRTFKTSGCRLSSVGRKDGRGNLKWVQPSCDRQVYWNEREL